MSNVADAGHVHPDDPATDRVCKSMCEIINHMMNGHKRYQPQYGYFLVVVGTNAVRGTNKVSLDMLEFGSNIDTDELLNVIKILPELVITGAADGDAGVDRPDYPRW